MTGRARNWIALAPLAAALVQVALHLTTLAPGVTTGDSGEIATAVANLGVIHPTGYPLFTLVGHVFTRVLPMESAIALAVMNVLFAGVVTVVVVVTVRLLSMHLADPQDGGRAAVVGTLAGVAAGWLLAITPGVWRQVRIGEVYPLHVLLVTLALHCWVRFEIERKDIWILLGAIPMGLGLAHHVTMVYMLPAVALYLMVRRPKMWTDWVVVPIRWALRRPTTTARHPWLLPVCCVVGASPLLLYGYFLWATANTEALSWGGVSDWDSLYRHVSGRQYRSYLKGFGYEAAAGRIGRTPLWWANQFTWAAAVPAVLGLGVLLRRAWPLGGFFLLYALANVAHSVQYATGNYREYSLPVLPVTAIVVGVGLGALVLWAEPRLRGRRVLGRELGGRRLGDGFLAAVSAGVMVLAATRYDAMDRPTGTAVPYLNDVERITTRGSLYIVTGDSYAFPVWYAQHEQGRMRDVGMVNVNMFGNTWYRSYLKDRHPLDCDPIQADAWVRPWDERCGPIGSRIAMGQEETWIKLGLDLSRGRSVKRVKPLDAEILDGGDPQCQDPSWRKSHRKQCHCWDYADVSRGNDGACVQTPEAGGRVVHRSTREQRIHALIADHIDERDVFERNALTRAAKPARNPRKWNGPLYYRVSADYALVNRGRINQVVYRKDVEKVSACGPSLDRLELRPHKPVSERPKSSRMRPPYRGNPQPQLIKYTLLQGLEADALTESIVSFGPDDPIRMVFNWFEQFEFDPAVEGRRGAPLRHGVRVCFYDPAGKLAYTRSLVTRTSRAKIAFPLAKRKGLAAGTYTVQACTVGDLSGVAEAMKDGEVREVPDDRPCESLILEYTFEIQPEQAGA